MNEHRISRELFQEAIEAGIRGGIQSNRTLSIQTIAALRKLGETTDRALVGLTVDSDSGCGCPMAKINGNSAFAAMGTAGFHGFASSFDDYLIDALNEKSEYFRVIVDG